METHFSDYVKEEHSSKSIREILDSPINILVGVDREEKNTLENLDIHTVYDLATSRIFNLAREITDAAENGGSPMSAYEYAPSDATLSEEKLTFEEIASGDIDLLPGIGEEFDDEVRRAIALETVRDFSLWPPFLAARAILQSLSREDGELTEEDEIPPELVPKARQYATEEVYYPKLFFDRILGELDEEGGDVEDLDRLGSVNILNADEDDIGFDQPGLGALIRFSQTWSPEGLSLGQLLHSLTLAPGESTRVAVIDWARSTTAQTEEAIRQSEQIATSTLQNRSIEEVHSGVVEESQSGFSHAKGKSTSKQRGGAGSFAGGILGSFGGGGSFGRSKTKFETSTVSSSSGRRSVDAEMMQKIRSATQQKASSARTRRASIVRETSQEEHEEVSTRTVANFNHMHSLNMHYYEVVQIYRVEVRPEQVEPVLYVPFDLVDFEDKRVVLRHRQLLKEAALDKYTRELITNTTGNLTLTRRLPSGVSYRNIVKSEEISSDEPTSTFTPLFLDTFRLSGAKSELEKLGVEFREDGTWDLPMETMLTGIKWSEHDTPTEQTMYIYLDDDERIPIHLPAGEGEGLGSHSLDTPRPFNRIDRIAFDFNPGESYNFDLRFEMEIEGQIVDLPVPVFVDSPGSTRTVVEVSLPTQFDELARVLNEEQLYYSQAIWQNLDPQTIALLLSRFRLGEHRVIEHIDPTPLGTHGNYIAFPLSLAEEDGQTTMEQFVEWWNDWKERNFDDDLIEDDLVPLPSGGVHGEAILGRANSAEKLDITRFWDWQESPIPIKAPDIQPVATGTRKTDEDLTPGSFDEPIINIQNTPGLPDPSDMSAVLGALTTSNIFRDMSGIEETMALAQQAMSESSEGAATSAALASENLQAAIESTTEKVKAGMALAAAAMGVPGGAIAGASNENSRTGALLEAARNHDMKYRSTGDGKTERSPVRGSSPGGNSPGVSSGGSSGGMTSDLSGSTSRRSGSLERELIRAAGNPAGSLADVVNGIESMDRSVSLTSDTSHSTGEGVTVFEDLDTPGLDEQNRLSGRLILANFDVDEAYLKEEHRAGLRQFSANLADSPAGELRVIEGHASQTGPEENNVQLSIDRATAVQEFLRSEGVDDSKMGSLAGLGSSSPLRDQPGSELDINRSVVIEYAEIENEAVRNIRRTVPKPRPDGQHIWEIRFHMTAGAHHAIGGAVAFGELRPRGSEDVYKCRFIGAGGGIGLASPGANPDPDWAWLRAPIPVTIEDFDNTVASLATYSGGFLIGGSQMVLELPALSILEPIGGISYGIVGLEASYNTGVFQIYSE